jgi:hypothetical protein
MARCRGLAVVVEELLLHTERERKGVEKSELCNSYKRSLLGDRSVAPPQTGMVATPSSPPPRSR